MLTLDKNRLRGIGRGYTMIEVLIALVILAIGIIGVAGLIAKMHQAETEAYQRAQALLLLQEMSSRVAIAGLDAGTYVTGTSTPLGTDGSGPASCDGLTFADLDKCVWSNALKGAAETGGGGAVGAMIGARGCVEQLQAFDTTSGVCTPGIFRVSVVWQGLTPTASQTGLACGVGSYGSDDKMRRAVSINVLIGLPKCV
jgi:type IV pilus assembly protein PilV